MAVVHKMVAYTHCVSKCVCTLVRLYTPHWHPCTHKWEAQPSSETIMLHEEVASHAHSCYLKAPPIATCTGSSINVHTITKIWHISLAYAHHNHAATTTATCAGGVLYYSYTVRYEHNLHHSLIVDVATVEIPYQIINEVFDSCGNFWSLRLVDLLVCVEAQWLMLNPEALGSTPSGTTIPTSSLPFQRSSDSNGPDGPWFDDLYQVFRPWGSTIIWTANAVILLNPSWSPYQIYTDSTKEVYCQRHVVK